MTEEERMGPYHEVLLLEHPAKGTPYFSADAYYARTGGYEICEKVTFADDFLQTIFLTPLSWIDTLFPEADGKTAQSRKGIDRYSYTQFDAAGVQNYWVCLQRGGRCLHLRRSKFHLQWKKWILYRRLPFPVSFCYRSWTL